MYALSLELLCPPVGSGRQVMVRSVRLSVCPMTVAQKRYTLKLWAQFAKHLTIYRNIILILSYFIVILLGSGLVEQVVSALLRGDWQDFN